MAKKLSAAFVRTVKEPGKYGDMHGLILRIAPGRSRQWVWRGTVHGRRRDLGLGAVDYVTLAEARALAFQYRKMARQGLDPAATRARAVPTFAELAEVVIGEHEAAWRNGGKSAAQWRASLRDYALPVLGKMPVDKITTPDVLSVVGPLWATKHETARRVRQRVCKVLDRALADGHRETNPCAALGAALPKVGNGRKHHKALPYADVAGALAAVEATAALPATKGAFRLMVLTAARSGEVRGMRWGEVDMGSATWTVPAERAKTGRAHRVPLSGAALAVLREARERTGGDGLVFASVRGKALTDVAVSKLLLENKIGAVPHGFRSSFRDWAAECTNFPREVAEHALAHVEGSASELAYRRTDYFERRRELMNQWAAYVTS